MNDIVPYEAEALDFRIDYKNYDFEKNKPDPKVNPHHVPVYLFLKLAKEFNVEVEYTPARQGFNAQFVTEKTEKLFEVYFSVGSANTTKTVLTVSWCEPSDNFIKMIGSMTGSDEAKQSVHLHINYLNLERDIRTLESTFDYKVKSNATFIYFYEKIISEIKLLLNT